MCFFLWMSLVRVARERREAKASSGNATGGAKRHESIVPPGYLMSFFLILLSLIWV